MADAQPAQNDENSQNLVLLKNPRFIRQACVDVGTVFIVEQSASSEAKTDETPPTYKKSSGSRILTHIVKDMIVEEKKDQEKQLNALDKNSSAYKHKQQELQKTLNNLAKVAIDVVQTAKTADKALKKTRIPKEKIKGKSLNHLKPLSEEAKDENVFGFFDDGDFSDSDDSENDENSSGGAAVPAKNKQTSKFSEFLETVGVSKDIVTQQQQETSQKQKALMRIQNEYQDLQNNPIQNVRVSIAEDDFKWNVLLWEKHLIKMTIPSMYPFKSPMIHDLNENSLTIDGCSIRDNWTMSNWSPAHDIRKVLVYLSLNAIDELD